MQQPQTFGRYELIRMVGSGGMAHVHLARQIGPQGFVKPCVLKRITPAQQHNVDVRRMFLEEARLSALLNHPNIVQTFDFGEVEGTAYLAMELVDGVNLAQLCRTLANNGRWLPLQPAIEIIAAILGALHYAHGLTDLQHNPLHLVHRDVSPQNTLLSKQGTVKLSDFGIARHEARETHTAGPSTKGKPGYMAPEQALSGEVDARADLFAVGIMLTELISARRVLTVNNRVQHILDIEGRVRSLCSLRQEAPPELVQLAVSLCALDPNQRPASAREAGLQLNQASARVAPSVPLHEFLQTIFHTYLPDVGLSANPQPPVQTQAGLPAEPPEVPAALPLPPAGTGSDLRFEQNAWEASDAEATATSVVYEGGGWPEAYSDEDAVPSLSMPLPEPEPEPTNVELVPNSSGVDAMQHFGAQMSEAAAQARAKPPRQSYNIGARPGQAAGLPEPEFGHPEPPDNVPSEIDDPRLRKALSTIDDDGSTKPRKPFSLPPVVALLVGGLAIAGLAIGVLVLVLGRSGPDEITKKSTGAIAISSKPAGGDIFLNGRPTGLKTPAIIKDQPIETIINIAVRKRGYRSSTTVDAQIPQLTLRTTAHFTLHAGRAYQLVSEPPEALVTVNGHRLGEPTPVTMDVLPFGETATITVQLEGHLPHHFVLYSRTDTATITQVDLQPAKSLEVSSNPPGAQVYLNGLLVGRTPQYEVLVPLKDRFSLKMTLEGFRPWRKRFRRGSSAESPVVADLKPMPFLALPWSKAERGPARTHDRGLTKTTRKLKKLKGQLEKAQAQQSKVEASISATVGDLAEVQRRTDLIQDAVVETEREIADLEAAMDGMREQLLLRMGEL